MKHLKFLSPAILLFIAALFSPFTTQAQNIQFSDTHFKAIYPALPKQSDKQLSCTFKDLIIGPNESKLFVLFRQDLTPD